PIGAGQRVRAPRAVAIECQLRAEPRVVERATGSLPLAAAKASPTDRKGTPARPIFLVSRASEPLGTVFGGVWSSDVLAPFVAAAAARHVSVRDPAVGGRFGAVVPLLGPRGVD